MLAITISSDLSSQNNSLTISELQFSRTINLEKGDDFKHWANSIILDDNQLLWITAYNLLYTYDGVIISERAHVENYHNYLFNRMYEINDTLFMFHQDSPPHYFAYKEDGDEIKKCNKNFDIFSHCLTSDSINLISTNNGEIKKYYKGKFETIFSSKETEDDKNYNPNYNSLILDKINTNKVWYYHKNKLFHISLNDGNYEVYNCLKENNIDLNYKKPHGSYSSALLQVENDIYIGSVYEGLVRFHIPTKTWHQYKKPVPPQYVGKEDYINSVLSILPYNDTTFILGGTMHAFYNKNEEKIYSYKGKHGKYTMPYCGSTLKVDDVIIRSNFNGGLSLLSKEGNKFDNQEDDTNVRSNRISSEGIQYVSDVFNLYGLDQKGDTILLIDIINEIGEEVSKDLLVDKNDNIWLGSSTGLIRYSTLDNSHRKFTELDGLATKNWNRNFSIGYNSENKIVARSGSNISTFDPDLIISKDIIELPYIYKVNIIDSTLFLSDSDNKKITFEPDEDYISIYYSLRDYNNGNSIRFDYKLDNYDKDWVTGNIENKASYNRLPPGTYNFVVRAINAEGKVSSVSEAYVIKVKAHWYESFWFKLCLILLTGIILFSFYKMKTSSLKRELALKSKFNEELSQVKLEALRSQMNPHFLFNCLNSIDNFILSNDAQNASEYLGKFSKLIRNILDYSKTNAITLREEIESTELYIKMEQMRFSDKFDYNITIESSIDQNIKSIPPLILQPYVENSIWHGLLHKEEKGNIQISISQEGNFYHIKIDDDGIGRQKAQSIKTKSATKRKSHGMKITEDRIRLVHQLNGQGGTVDTIDKKDSDGYPLGTAVIIKLAIPLS